MRAAHLAVLTSFALAQPLFDILGRNATFFVARRSSSTEIVVFALGVTFLPPAILIAAELFAGLFGTGIARIVHFVLVGGLTAVVALQVLKKVGLSGTVPLLVGSALLGLLGLLLYSESPPARTFLTVLTPAPIVFLALFLGTSDVSKLVFEHEQKPQTVRTGSKTPVVLIVFDELSTISVMNRNQQIDAVRYPNFAALARGSTWYRSATTVETHTEQAVPVVLTGQLPKRGQLPTYADHPHSIFTLFGGDYRLRVFESLTRLCPRSLCKKVITTSEAPAGTAAVEGGKKNLVSDASVVYLHTLLPDGLARHVPPIGESWGNFRGLREPKDASQTDGGRECARGLCDFIRALTPSRKPSLFMVHTLLPHVPWVYLPSGRRYTGNVRVIPGAEDVWRRDDWLTQQAYQRYLLQLAYTDLELGIILHRLKAQGLYDRALVVVLPDHGLSFRPGEPRRNVTRRNMADVAFVPMFVKLPGQKRGRIVDGLARTTDVLPTIAKAVGTRIPWHVDGHPLGRTLPRDGQVTLLDKDGNPVSAALSTLLAERRVSLAQQIALFGTGSRERLYRIGPHRGLLGKRVLALGARESSNVEVDIDGAQLLNSVDLRSEIIPAYVTGRISGGRGRDEDLAVALNGTIAATTRTYDDSGEERFAALVPERMLHTGSNLVEVFAVTGPSASPKLERLRSNTATLVLRKQGGREVIDAGKSTKLAVTPGALSGSVHAVTPGESVILSGWAADLAGKAPADSIAVFLDGKSVLELPVDIRRKTIESRYGIENTGFRAELPKRIMPPWGQGHRIRIVAFRGDTASELRYEGRYLTADRRD